MDFVVTIPCSYSQERDYILSVVLREFLGLNYVIRRTSKTDVCISDTDERRCLLIPDGLFAVPEKQWLTHESLPKQPLKVWEPDTMSSLKRFQLVPVPVIYDVRKPDDRPNCTDTGSISLPFDIFGSAFFMLTRYEEVVKTDRDQHDRFPSGGPAHRFRPREGRVQGARRE